MNITHGFAQTPSSNTGSPSFTLDNNQTTTENPRKFPFDVVSKPKAKLSACVDWLQGVGCTNPAQFDFLVGEIGNIFKDFFETDDKPIFTGRNFAHCRRSAKGGKIAWNYLDTDLRRGDIDWWLCLPASMLRGADTYQLRRFIAFLVEMGFKCTRLDIAIDDFTKSLDKLDFISACESDLHHGFKTYGEQWQVTSAKPKGWTFYMGSFGSDKLYRFYDKSVESDGEIDSYRLEGQFRDDYATQIFGFLHACGSTHDKFLKTLVNVVCGYIDFFAGKRGKETGKDKFVRCEFWQNFLDFCNSERIDLGCGRSKSSIERSLQWIEKSVARTLATIEEFYEGLESDFGEYLNGLLEAGRRKIRNPHQTQVKSALLQLGVTDSISYKDACAGFF